MPPLSLRPWLWLTLIESSSMEPTLHPEQLVLTRALRRSELPVRGDIVIIDSSEVGECVVKRIIGLPGERIDVVGGTVLVDGVVLDEPYAAPSVFHGRFTIPDGHYVVMGDNRDASDDSRLWSRPYIGRQQIIGLVILPHRRTGSSPNQHPTLARLSRE